MPERFKNSLDDGAGNQQSRKGSDADAGKRKRLKSQLESPLEAPLQEHLGDVKPKPQIGEEIVEKPEARHENPYFHSPFGRLQ